MSGKLLDRLALRTLHKLDAETAHNLTIKALSAGLVPASQRKPDSALAASVCGLDFPNPLAVAAGFDKNAQVPDALLKLGLGFAEVGTVTPRPQSGNPRPRVFRLPEDNAVINRFGFNNVGREQVHERLLRRLDRAGIVGVNVGANKESKDKVADYVSGIHFFADVASYFTVNISSPNTAGLREMQDKDMLNALLSSVIIARDEMTRHYGRKVPVFLKIAPDLDDQQLSDICREVQMNMVDGLIVSNSTTSRDGLKNTKSGKQSGGLSGRPLFRRSTMVLAKARSIVGADFPIIGVGGIDSGETAWTKITAGANLLQLYTGLTYCGLGLIDEILDYLAAKVKDQGLSNLQEAVGRNVEDWASGELV
ncbi:MAG: quinone-dependent dihydroorotate dehydrogenase [Stappiaceae bacterium]